MAEGDRERTGASPDRERRAVGGGPGRPAGRSGAARADAADRVRRSQAQARAALRLVLAFVAAAAIAAAAAYLGDAVGRWVPLHLFLAGAVVLAISGVSLMLTVTWSAAPAPPDRWVAAQRAAVAGGAAGLVAARAFDLPGGLVAAAGLVHLGGLLGLAGLLVTTVRRGPERRFDPAVAAYMVAIGFGAVGGGLGATMAARGVDADLRSAHVAANLLGLVGLVVGGTLPFFAATVGRSKMLPGATPRRLLAVVGYRAVAVGVAVGALAAGRPGWAALGLAGDALGVALTVAAMPRPTRRQLRWSGPRLVALWAGAAWWAAALVGSAFDAAAGRGVLAGRWLIVLVVAGLGQVLWGSLAYLLPMLRGGGHVLLGAGFTATRSWAGLAAVNVAGGALAVDRPTVAAVAVAVWLVDAAVRASRVGTAQASRPEARGGSDSLSE